MKVKLDYKLTEDELKAAKSPQYMTADYIGHAVSQKYPEGLKGQLRRVYGRIQRKLDQAIEDDAASIKLEDGEKDFILDCFKDVKFPFNVAKFVMVLEDEIRKFLEDELDDEVPKNKKGKVKKSKTEEINEDEE